MHVRTYGVQGCWALSVCLPPCAVGSYTGRPGRWPACTAPTYARKHPRHGFRRAWAYLRFDDGIEVNKKKVHRLWKEEGLQVRRAPRRKRAGQSSVPIVAADAPKMVWALDFQFDSTVDGKKVQDHIDGR